MNEQTSEIIQNVLTSKKYHAVYKPTVKRIVESMSQLSSYSDVEEKTRNLLHQIWGAYYPIRPNFIKLERKVAEKIARGETQETIITELLSLHASTKERLANKQEFYKEIFSYTGIPDSIIDHACGLNPLMIPWMHLPETTRYHAFDIDIEEVVFLEKIVGKLNIIPKPTVRAGDILIDTFPYADVIFLFKLLPVLKMQQKEDIFNMLNKQQCRFLVMSFPVKSLGGKEKGMKDFYSEQFIASVEKHLWKYKRLLFPSELVFIINK